MTPSRREFLGPDRSGKAVQRFMAVYEHRYEGAQLSLEAKSPRAAARIAKSYELVREGRFYYLACTLIELLVFKDGYYWGGVDRALIEGRQCAGCLRKIPAHRVTAIGSDWLCGVCLNGHAVISVYLWPMEAEHFACPKHGAVSGVSREALKHGG